MRSLKSAALSELPWPQCGPQSKTIAHPCRRRCAGCAQREREKPTKIMWSVIRHTVLLVLHEFTSKLYSQCNIG